MKVGLVSDIHGNLEALEVALKILKERNIDRINVLGDIVGYMVNPNECVELIKEYECIIGNHDFATFDTNEINHFNPCAKEAIEWTKKIITKENVEFLKSLPDYKIYKKENYTIVHGALNDRFEYIYSPIYAKINLKLLETQVLFTGHTHIPTIFRGQKKHYKHNPNKFKYIIEEIDVFDRMVFHLKENEKYVINVGSVGQPRDNCNLGSLVIFDTDNRIVQFIRFDYPRNKTIQKIIELNRPKFLYERLIQGQ